MTHEFLAYQLIVLTCIAFLIGRTVLKFILRKKSFREVILAFLIWGSIGSLALFPNLAQFLAEALGFEVGINAILTISTIVIFFCILSMMVKTDKQNTSLTKLVRELALQEVRNKK